MIDSMNVRYKLFICHDRADRKTAIKVGKFINKKFSNFSCATEPYYSPGDNETKKQIINAIHTCDVFLMLLSRRSINQGHNLRQHFGWKYADAIKLLPNNVVVFFFLDDPKIFSPYFLNTITDLVEKPQNRNHVFKIQPDFETRNNIGSALLKVLTKIGGRPAIVETNVGTSTPYNVFISYKSKDIRYAKAVYDLLNNEGLNVFFSSEVLPDLGSDAYHKKIDSAIENATHMIVVGTCHDHFNAKWVEYEWRLFLGEILAGRKKGNLITVIGQEMPISDLPISLRNRESIRFEEIRHILAYVCK